MSPMLFHSRDWFRDVHLGGFTRTFWYGTDYESGIAGSDWAHASLDETDRRGAILYPGRYAGR
eukprot:2268769-Rhodomonas_salina.1